MLEDQVDILAVDKQLYQEKATSQKRAYAIITTLQTKARQTQDLVLLHLASKSSDEVTEFYEL